MPELPDITVYIDHLETRLVGQTLEHVRLLNPFVLRSVTPPIAAAEGTKVTGLRRLGKRIVIELESELFLVLHLMIAGRLRWVGKDAKLPGRITLAAFEFPSGTLIFTEAGTKRRASMHLVEGEAALAAMDPGGLEVLEAGLEEFAARLKRENHTLKRALCDPRLFSGIGNAYSDEGCAVLCALRSRDYSALPGDARDARRMDRAAQAARRRRISGEGHRLSRGHGGARPLRQALPRVRCAGAENRLCRERDQLLRALPDRG